jgi:hypothetical protein
MLQSSWSFSQWGDWYVDSVPVPPEYYWYSQFTYDESPALNLVQATNITG